MPRIDENQIQRITSAKANLVEAARVIWNTRLELLVAMGISSDEVLGHVEATIEEACNNCDCNTCGPPGTGCGALELPEQFTADMVRFQGG